MCPRDWGEKLGASNEAICEQKYKKIKQGRHFRFKENIVKLVVEICMVNYFHSCYGKKGLRMWGNSQSLP